MKARLQFLSKVYAGLLTLYPQIFRDQFGEELQSVFRLSMQDAARRGGWEAEQLFLRELISLPKAIALEHLRQRTGKMLRKFDSVFAFAYGSWKEFLTALLPFFLPGVAMPLLSYSIRLGLLPASSTLGTGILLTSFGLFLILLIVGMQTQMPRWALPYFGFVFSVLSVYLFSLLLGAPIYFLFRNLRDTSLLMDIIWDGIFWYGLLLAIVLLAMASRTSPRLQRFRDDWTLLCFVLYGAAPFALWLTFDEYGGDEPYSFLIFLVLAFGAWLYLHINGEWKRFGVLFGALSVAILIAAGSKAILIPAQTWPFAISSSLVISEVKHTLLMGLWLAFGMLVPPGMKFWPSSNASAEEFPAGG